MFWGRLILTRLTLYQKAERKIQQFPDAIGDAELAAFGFGRRICPGRHLACASIWIGIASVLAMFDLEKVVDEKGEVIEPSGEYTSGLVRYERSIPLDKLVLKFSAQLPGTLQVQLQATL